MTPPESTYHFTPRHMRQAMIERGLELDFPPAARPELAAIGGPAGATDDVRDLRDRLWASIDNDDSPKGTWVRIFQPPAEGGWSAVSSTSRATDPPS